MRFFWILPLLGASVAGLVLILTFITSKGAPQEAAGFALACAVAIVPYVFTKAMVALFDTSLRDSTDQIVNAIHNAANHTRG